MKMMIKMIKTMRNEDGKTAAGMVMMVMMVMMRKPDDFEVEHDDRHEVVVTHIAYRSLWHGLAECFSHLIWKRRQTLQMRRSWCSTSLGWWRGGTRWNEAWWFEEHCTLIFDPSTLTPILKVSINWRFTFNFKFVRKIEDSTFTFCLN